MALIGRDDWDGRALREGISVAALGAVPFGVIGRLVLDEDSASGVLAVFALLVLVALTLGAGVAAWRQAKGRPLTHGIAASMVTYGAVQAAGIVRRLIASDDIRWGRIASTGLLSLIAGTVGGLLGGLMVSRGVTSRRP